ncbi:3-oxoacyl-[acyl-carrier-protein] synthase [Pyrus ussuriensis x Pyrus communis]|uniref:beta-ketoacyl-[acyl-carrier-protein] synthase I n=1 Tax=Pyrus ussuriensis x Pyrus communis TaxID=2448454 RepID=A0A5N5GIT4_9ROSA|nr:3-oxoacyl-[acyl-carrier-protein] synthase [Pyrus ussuriensis x Pyrus communis]
MAVVGAPKTMASPAWRKLFTRRMSSSFFDPLHPLVLAESSSPVFSFSSLFWLGMVPSLGCGVETTALTPEDIKMNGFDSDTQSYTFDKLTSKVAAIVPCGSNPGEFNEELWLNSKVINHRSMARFIGYALYAAVEALKDASWIPTEPEERERTGVPVGGGTGSNSHILDAAQMICQKRIRRLSPFFIPQILINMASGHISMKYGFQGPNHAAVTACATGAHSLGDSTRMIQFGDSDVMVAGGT